MKTILIVDAEPFELAGLRALLDGDEYDFVTAEGGLEAKRILQRHAENVSAILLDWILPDVDGVELLQWMKSHPALASVEVIVESAEFDADSIRKGIDCGAYYYLTKPFERSQLQAIVRAAISSFELKRSLAHKTEEAEDTFGLLESGTFTYRTLDEAELLAVHIASSGKDPDKAVPLLELLVNAVEHGNLQIGYDDKTELLRSRTFRQEIARRLTLPEYRNRRVRLDVARHPTHLNLVITDEGSGFDYRNYLTLNDARLFDSHGRGIVLASAMLEIQYVGTGNTVQVRLPVAPPTA